MGSDFKKRCLNAYYAPVQFTTQYALNINSRFILVLLPTKTGEWLKYVSPVLKPQPTWTKRIILI